MSQQPWGICCRRPAGSGAGYIHQPACSVPSVVELTVAFYRVGFPYSIEFAVEREERYICSFYEEDAIYNIVFAASKIIGNHGRHGIGLNQVSKLTAKRLRGAAPGLERSMEKDGGLRLKGAAGEHGAGRERQTLLTTVAQKHGEKKTHMQEKSEAI